MFSIHQITERLQDYFNDDKYEDAIIFLEQLKNEESSAESLNLINNQLGRIYFFRKEYDLAKAFFYEAIRQMPLDFYSKIFLSKILELENKIFAAMKVLGRAFNEDERQQQVLYTIKNKIENVTNDEDEEIDKLLKNKMELASEIERASDPKISIIILCYNKVEFTEKCLRSLFKNTHYKNYEVIVVDNASVDETPGLLESYGDRIKFIHSNKNLGFVGGNNFAVEYTSGDFFVFLNNDTEVLPNWLENLYSIFKYYPDAGAAGSMLIYPNGKLQEAGGAIFSNATGWNYGKNGNPIDSKYSYVREVDYCSGAALMVRSDLFIRLGGFDVRYAPAYYEDTDLCFGIRKLGYKVYYSPFSKVVHYEGATSGTDVTTGFKKFQILNSPKFIGKWEKELKLQYPDDAEQYFFFTNRKKGKRILVIDDIPPLPDRAAGALRHYHTLNQMLELGYQVTYVHLMGSQYTDDAAAKYLINFKMRGVEFIWFDYESWWEIRDTPQVKTILTRLIDSLELKRRKFDLAYIAFWHIADYFVDLIRERVPHLPILVDTMDIHYLREQRQAEMANDPVLKKQAEENKKKEITLYSKVDCVTTVTENDRDELRKYLPNKSVIILTDVHDAVETKTPFSERKDFLFVGNFNHTPNADAVIYFVKSIFPLIKKQLPNSKFYIVGSNPSAEVKNLASGDIIVTGWVPEILPYLEQCKVSVVPLRYGAGNKGKVGETLSHGLPMVSTTIGAEGMNLISGEHSFITDDQKQFAEYAVELYTNEELWQRFSKHGMELISNQYSSKMMRKRLEYILSLCTIEKFRGKNALYFPNPPKVSIILIAFNQFEYTKKCIESIIKYTKTSHEIILIDNHSNDETVKSILPKFPEIRLIENSDNLGFPKAANQGILAALGDYVLLLNNDTVVTENWLERLIKIAENEKEIGIVGPISNEVSGLQIDRNAIYADMREMHTYAKKIAENNAGEILNFPRVAFLCTLIKKEVIEKIGGLDERFSPGNYEDDDFCLRAQIAGFKTVIAKDVFIHHYGSKSFKADGEKKYAERLEINKQKFVSKWGVTPDELWIQRKEIKPHQSFYPISKNKFDEHFERARILLADNELDLAFESLQNALEHFHKVEQRKQQVEYHDLLDLAGNLSLANGNLELAQKYFAEELEIIPTSSTACAGLGEVFLAQGMNDNAKVMFEWAIKNNPSNNAAIAALSNINTLLGYEANHNSLLLEV